MLFRSTNVRDWNNEPLYVLDEWTSYANGSQAGFEAGRREQHSEQCAVAGCHFADALVAAVRNHDPNYPQLDELVAFVEWQKTRVASLVGFQVAKAVDYNGQERIVYENRCQIQWDGRQWVKVCPTQQPQPAAAPRPIIPSAWKSAVDQMNAQQDDRLNKIERRLATPAEVNFSGYVPRAEFDEKVIEFKRAAVTLQDGHE